MTSAALFFDSVTLENVNSDNVNLVLIQGDSLKNMNPLNVSWNDTTLLMNSRGFDKSRKSVVITYGWLSNFSSPIINATVESLLTRRLECNIFVLDWSYFTNQNYLASVASIPSVADYIATNLKKINKSGVVNLEDFHFVGHSLGSHLFGNVGRRLQELANITVARITGLDPAGPLFFPSIVLNVIKPLEATNAGYEK
jgi:pancreatic triacylglycerol lipase